MKIAPWLRALRLEHNWNLDALATRAGVDTATVSRIESGQSQPTLETVIRLTTALGCEPGVVQGDLLGQPAGRRAEPDLTSPSRAACPYLTLADVDAFVAWLRRDRWAAKQLLANLAYEAETRARNQGPSAVSLIPPDLDRLAYASPLFRFEVQYPRNLAAGEILEVGRAGGVLTPADIGQYLRAAREEKGLTLSGLGRQTGISASTLSRFEMGVTDRAKLDDVLRLDKTLRASGAILELFWRSAEFVARAGNEGRLAEEAWADHERALANVLVVTARWLQATGATKPTWLKSLRRSLPPVVPA